MSDSSRHELLRMISEYLDSNRRDPGFVAMVEGAVLNDFQAEIWFDEVSEQLALFVPNGDGQHSDENDLAKVLERLRTTLDWTPAG